MGASSQPDVSYQQHVASGTRPTLTSAPRANPHELELISQHETMKAEVRDTLAALDDLISGLET